MPQMTGSAVRVVDPVLTEVARGYRNPAYIGSALFPRVPVGVRGGRIIEFGKESFRLYNTARAPGSKVVIAQFGYSGQPYALEDHSISGMVPIEHLEEASQTPGIDMGSGAVQFARDIILLRQEYDQATIARNPASYAASNKVTLYGTRQWSDYSGTSDPIADIEDFIDVIRSKTGMRPNTLELGAPVFKAVKNHPKVIERIKYTGRESATPELLASLLGLQRVVVGDAIYTDADGNTQDVWGKDAVLAFTNTAPLSSMGVPSYGYTYGLRGYPLSEPAYYDGGHKSWLYPTSDSVSPVIAGADAGFLIVNAVA